VITRSGAQRRGMVATAAAVAGVGVTGSVGSAAVAGARPAARRSSCSFVTYSVGAKMKSWRPSRSLAELASFEVEWPYIKYDETEASFPPYQVHIHRIQAKNVKRVDVLLDLQRDAVVHILPGPEAVITRVPSSPVTK
jgi:hypothetical protein